MRVEGRANAKGVRRRGVVLLLAGGVSLALSQFALPAAKATGNVQAWEASANSALVGVSPSASGVYLTSTIGQASAAYDQTETQATSALVNLGGLGYAVASSPVCGFDYSLSQQPQPLSADSSNGPSSATAQAQLYPRLTTPSGIGTEHVSVSVNPESAEARTYPLAESVRGLVDVEGVAQSQVDYVSGQAQEASASVTEDLSLLGGKVAIDGLTWSASQKRGASESTSQSAFSYSSITLIGAPIPVSIPGSVPLSTALSKVNGVLGTFGVSVTAPTRSIDPGTGGVSMSPLQVHFSGSALDNELASPTVGPLTQVINLLNGQVTHGVDCSKIKNLLGQLTTTPETGLNLLISGLSGAGAVDLYFGGASADTLAAPSYSNPFDFTGSLGATPLPPSGASGLPASGSPTGFVPASGVPSGSVSAPSPVSATIGSSSVTQRASRAAVVKCTTTNPLARGGCWRGLATWAASAVIALGGGLLAADSVYSHRRPRPRRRRARFLT